MSHYADLSPCGFFENKPPFDYGYKNIVAIGWIDTDGKQLYADFPKGEVPDGFVEKLKDLADTREEHIQYFGEHDCCECGAGLGQGHLFLPADGVVYCAPASIGHYVTEHGYRPPEQFVKAVMERSSPLAGDRHLEEIRAVDECFWWVLAKNNAIGRAMNIDKSLPAPAAAPPWQDRWNKASAERNARYAAEEAEMAKARVPKDELQERLRKAMLEHWSGRMSPEENP